MLKVMDSMTLEELKFLAWMLVNWEGTFGETATSRDMMEAVREQIRLARMSEV